MQSADGCFRRYSVDGMSINTFTIKTMPDGSIVTDNYLAGMDDDSRGELLDHIARMKGIVIRSMIEGVGDSVIEYPRAQ